MTTPAGFADTVSTVDGHDPHQTDHRLRRPTAAGARSVRNSRGHICH